ncbi:hypothetical protein BS47DRAFT_672015 [Hydnum rufescens UP504]|uniref:Uncharacterized protein n=1 Tax=Hydnum rufescens UP504 TaxID=1448309 RepID=A0A9P6AFV4_9AGAM|nr:hypothetical protein BS47DRAFT_672015 [Hydnum rufescens UP504]
MSLECRSSQAQENEDSRRMSLKIHLFLHMDRDQRDWDPRATGTDHIQHHHHCRIPRVRITAS